LYRRAPVRWGWEWECDRRFAVMGAIARVGPGHGDMNILVMVVMLSMPCPYRFRDRLFFVMDAIAGFLSGGAGVRRYEYFNDGCDFLDAVHLQIWGGRITTHPTILVMIADLTMVNR